MSCSRAILARAGLATWNDAVCVLHNCAVSSLNTWEIFESFDALIGNVISLLVEVLRKNLGMYAHTRYPRRANNILSIVRVV